MAPCEDDVYDGRYDAFSVAFAFCAASAAFRFKVVIGCNRIATASTTRKGKRDGPKKEKGLDLITHRDGIQKRY